MTTHEKVWSIISLVAAFAILVALSWGGYMYYQLGLVRDVLEDPGIIVLLPDRNGSATSTEATSTPAAPLITP